MSSLKKAFTRLNKCLPRLSRRAADVAIGEGRVTVDGRRGQFGERVSFKNVVRLDGEVQEWQRLEKAKASGDLLLRYVKYWKPPGEECTGDPLRTKAERLFTVGRLDKDTSGLLLLTNDGRVNNAVLRPKTRQTKRYVVTLDSNPSEADLRAMAKGVDVVISEPPNPFLFRKGPRRVVRTLPCRIDRLGAQTLAFEIHEGRNRHVRRVCEARGLTVLDLHRTHFAGLSLAGLRRAGDWIELDRPELAILRQAIATYSKRTTQQEKNTSS